MANVNPEAEPAYFPEDLQMEIASKLPVKSILKFRCVSRTWKLLLSDKSMEGKRVPSCMEHLIYYSDLIMGNYRPMKCDLCMECIPVLGVSVTDGISHGDCITIASLKLENIASLRFLFCVNVCNGLILVRIGMSMKYMVWNPANGTYILLPRAPEHFRRDLVVFAVELQYDPKISHHFKVVCFLAHKASPIFKLTLLIFSSEVGEWVFSNDIVIGPLPPSGRRIPWRNGCSHGALHLMLLRSHVAQFDFVEETFHLIKLPGHEDIDQEGLDVPAFSHTLGVSKGSPHYALCDGKQLRVWRLEDDCSSTESTNKRWVLKHMVLVEELVPQLLDIRTGNACRLLIVSCFHPNAGDAIFFEVGQKVWCYEMQMRRVTLQHISQIIPGGYNPSPIWSSLLLGRSRLSPYSPCLVNLFEWYNLDDREKQLAKKQWSFKNVEEINS